MNYFLLLGSFICSLIFLFRLLRVCVEWLQCCEVYLFTPLWKQCEGSRWGEQCLPHTPPGPGSHHPIYLPPALRWQQCVCQVWWRKAGYHEGMYPVLALFLGLIQSGLCGKICRESVLFCAGDDHGTFRHSVWEWLFWIWCVFSSWLSNVPSPDKPWDHRKPHHQV